MQNSSRWPIIRVKVGTVLPWCLPPVVSRTLLHPQAKIHGCSSPLYKMHSACMLSLQLGPTLCDPMDCSPTGSPVLWVLQARILEWVVMPSSSGSSQPRNRTCVSLCLLPWAPSFCFMNTFSHFLVLLIFASVNGQCLRQLLLQCPNSDFPLSV